MVPVYFKVPRGSILWELVPSVYAVVLCSRHYHVTAENTVLLISSSGRKQHEVKINVQLRKYFTNIAHKKMSPPLQQNIKKQRRLFCIGKRVGISCFTCTSQLWCSIPFTVCFLYFRSQLNCPFLRETFHSCLIERKNVLIICSV